MEKIKQLSEKSDKITKRKGVTYRKGYRRSIIQLLFTNGCISKKGLQIMPGDYQTYSKKITEMKKEGILEELNIGNHNSGLHKTVRLCNLDQTMEWYLPYFRRYNKYYEIYSKDNRKVLNMSSKYQSRRIKAYRESEVTMLMYAAGIRVYPDEKALIDNGEKIPTYPPAFYNSKEVRKGGADRFAVKEEGTVITSRIIGVMISEGGYYAVFHTENSMLIWSASAEGQMAWTIGRFINNWCQQIPEEEYEQIDNSAVNEYFPREKEKEEESENIHFEGAVEDAILIGYRNSIYENIYLNEKRGNINLTNCGYKHMYAIPYTEDGKILLHIMSSYGWKEQMVEDFLPDGFEKTTHHSTIECDGKCGEQFILLYVIPDLVRLKKFMTAAEWNSGKNEYIVMCFDFQTEFIKAIAPQHVQIQVTPFTPYAEYLGLA